MIEWIAEGFELLEPADLLLVAFPFLLFALALAEAWRGR